MHLVPKSESEKTVDGYVKKTILKENSKNVYSLIWGQCSDVRLKSILVTLTLPRQARHLLYFKPSRTVATNFNSRNTSHRNYKNPRNGFTSAINYEINPSLL
jgi:hypothetical protein